MTVPERSASLQLASQSPRHRPHCSQEIRAPDAEAEVRHGVADVPERTDEAGQGEPVPGCSPADQVPDSPPNPHAPPRTTKRGNERDSGTATASA